MHKRLLAALLLLVALWSVVALAGDNVATTTPAFALRDADRVIFFGDSITEQRLYTRFIEQFVVTRFPDRKITFFNAGVSGDRVSGGWTGPIDLRLRRDLLKFEPTLVTVMLGMNDGYYRAYDEGIFQTYEEGFRHIVDVLGTKAPNARLTLIKPSAFDDVTRTPQFEQGYNGVLVRMGSLVETVAHEKHAGVADMNAPMVAALTKAKTTDPALATTLMFDRVHPGAGIHWIMANAVLKSWAAPALVTSVGIDGEKSAVSESQNTQVTDLRKNKKTGVLTWTQSDRALPLPLPSPASDPITALAIQASTVVQDLDQQTLRVTGLREGNYELRIDDTVIGTFSTGQLNTGINLATMETPMLNQARIIAFDNDCKNGLEAARFSMVRNAYIEPVVAEAISKLDRSIVTADDRQRADARPLPHKYTLTSITAQPAKSIAAGR